MRRDGIVLVPADNPMLRDVFVHFKREIRGHRLKRGPDINHIPVVHVGMVDVRFVNIKTGQKIFSILLDIYLFLIYASNMNTRTRTDVHRPSVINPADYEYVAPEHGHDDTILDFPVYRERIRAHMKRTSGSYSRHDHGGNCGICGNANVIYTVLFYHRPSNTYVRMGEECAMNVDASFDNREFRRFKDAISAERDAKAGKTKAQKILAGLGLSPAWDIAVALRGGPESRRALAAMPDERESTRIMSQLEIVQDLVEQLIKRGELSEKQIAFLGRLLDQYANRHQAAAQRQAEHDQAKDAPSGRLNVAGRVLSVKPECTDFGDVWKVLVQTQDGWKCYGTLPSQIREAQAGDWITFKATLTVSQKDSKFAFFSRPTGGAVVPTETVLENVLCAETLNY